MKPILFHLGPFPVFTFGAMIALGVFISLFLLTRKSRRTGFPATPEMAADLIFVTVFSGFLGGRLFYIIENIGWYLRSPLKIFALWEGGLIFYGGVAGSLVGLYLFSRSKHISYLKVLDFLIPYVALTHAFGRVGCFFNGCCSGKACELPWAILVDGARVHPVQLYEAAYNFLLFLFLSSLGTGSDRDRFQQASQVNLSRSRTGTGARFDGEIISLYFIAYATGRFIFEFFRAANPVLGILTWNQWESLLLIAAGLGIYGKTHSRRS